VRRIGVLALQGGFAAHVSALERAGFDAVEVRSATMLDDVGGLVLPGGESTTQLKLIDRFGLETPLDAFVRSGRPVLATCAGLILASRAVRTPEQRSFGWLDVTTERNAWGRQSQSFEATADDGRLALLFIRAPRIVEVAPEVTVLATYHGETVLVRQGNVTGATFHPELTGETRVLTEAFSQARHG
jgi:5'-phosphate synthase pdxT subunit